MPPHGTRLLQLLARLGLAAALGWAGLAKLGDPSALAEAVANFRLVPEPLVPLVATALPATEIVVAVSLLGGPCVQGGAIVGALLFAAFAVAMAQARVRGIDLDCGCFGAGVESQVTWTKVLVDVGLAGVAAAIAWAEPAAWRAFLPSSSERRKEATG